jgi:hypothetical protein
VEEFKKEAFVNVGSCSEEEVADAQTKRGLDGSREDKSSKGKKMRASTLGNASKRKACA